MTGVPRVVFTIAALAAFGLAVACNGDGGSSPPSSSTVAGTGAAPTFPSNENPTPSSLEEARQTLSGDLDAIGANIGSVPPDIQRGIIEKCVVLSQFADGDTVRGICDDVQRAMDTNDPGLLDSVLRRLSELQAG